METLSTISTVLLFSLPIASAIYLVSRNRKSIRTWIASWVFSYVGCYAFLLLEVQATEIHLENELERLDPDGNGLFSSDEMTPKIRQTMDRYTYDTGRSLAPFTGLITCPLYSGFWHCVIGIPFFRLSNSKINQSKNQSA